MPAHDNDNPPLPHGRSLGCTGRYPVHGTNEVCATFQFPSKSARRTYFVANRIIGPARRGEGNILHCCAIQFCAKPTVTDGRTEQLARYRYVTFPKSAASTGHPTHLGN